MLKKYFDPIDPTGFLTESYYVLIVIVILYYNPLLITLHENSVYKTMRLNKHKTWTREDIHKFYADILFSHFKVNNKIFLVFKCVLLN